MSILGRGIITIEGVLAVCSPQVNFMQIMVHNVSGNLLKQFDLKQALLVMGDSGSRLGRVY
jgi:ubiquinone biosynthesis protein